jgi:hypothetical protein
MSKATTAEDIERSKRYWLADNPGVLTRIANEFNVKQPFVSDVFHKRRKSEARRIETRLAQLGAPGFEKGKNPNGAQ